MSFSCEHEHKLQNFNLHMAVAAAVLLISNKQANRLAHPLCKPNNRSERIEWQTELDLERVVSDVHLC
jgi:hypothetical protein